VNFPRFSGILLHPTSLPSRFGIGELGTKLTVSLIFFKDGREVNRLIGVQSADVLQSQLDRFK
jgi:4-alpha-glucanotransferase